MRKTFKIAPEDWSALNQLRGRPAAQRLYGARMGQRMGFDPESVLPTHSLTSFTAFRSTRPGLVGTRNNLRGDGVLELDLGLGKDFRMPWEGHKLQFRWEVFNVTNTARFDPQSLNLSITDSLTFGSYTGTLTPPRVMQFGLRYEF